MIWNKAKVSNGFKKVKWVLTQIQLTPTSRNLYSVLSLRLRLVLGLRASDGGLIFNTEAKENA